MAQVLAVIETTPSGSFGVSFPDFPCSGSSGPTVEAALERARENLIVHIDCLVELGTPMPELRSHAEITTDPDHLELIEEVGSVAYAYVAVDLPGRPVSFDVMIEKELLERIDLASSAAGETRSVFLAKAARERLAHL